MAGLVGGRVVSERTPADFLPYLDRAREFEDAARQLIARPDLRAPALHLIAHGFELTFKSVLLHSGRSERELRTAPFGHDLLSMWNREELSSLRQYVPEIAVSVTNNAVTSEIYLHPRAFSSSRPADLFLEQLELLSELHSRGSDYVLRYPAGNPIVPMPPFLGDVLGCLIDVVRERFLPQRS
jgi:hypothetical protein